MSRARAQTRERSEQALIVGVLAGSQADLEVLFERHWRPAYRAAFLVVHDHGAAEDIAQEAFLAAIRALDRFDRHRRFGPWLHAIVVNRSIDCVRARTARHESGLQPPDTVPYEESRRGYSPELLAALATLPPEQRAVIVMRHVLQYTPGEIAHVLELPRGTVNSRLRRGLDALQSTLCETESP